MNRNMKGEVFSREELIAMAVEIGAIEASTVSREMKTWEFLEMTKAHRLGMFLRGEAILNTRPEPTKPFVPLTVDEEFLAALHRLMV